jgi:hypothetical protein
LSGVCKEKANFHFGVNVNSDRQVRR